jgi:hypothetical protein
MLYGVCCMVYGVRVGSTSSACGGFDGIGCGFNSVGKSFAVYFKHECKQMYMHARSVQLWYISMFGHIGME